MKYKVYTIEYGYIYGEDDDLYCTNEESFIDENKYKIKLKSILESAIGNYSKKGFYIECYEDIMELTKEDLENLREFNCLVDCPYKNDMTQNFIIKNGDKYAED